MSVNAHVQRAARIVDQVTPENPADAVLRESFAGRADLEAADKRATVRLVFTYYRWLRWLDERAATVHRVAEAADLQARFEARPDSFKSETLAERAVPAWIADEMAPIPAGWLRQIQHDPALWIRVQREFARALPRALGECSAADLAAFPGAATEPPTALRYRGPKDLFRTDEFKKGLFEIQDLASQLVGHACAPQPGETWWDACAGEGGKTLHLGDLMGNKGLIWASDRSTRRLATLRKRTARARMFNYRAVTWNGGPFLPTKTRFDGVLVDAPCSGVGTWQRNPHARWTTGPEDVRELAALQIQLLDHVAPTLKPGGRLVYAVCTLTRSETTAVAEAFAARHPEFVPAPIFGGPARQTFWPQDIDANGMFVAAWTRALT